MTTWHDLNSDTKALKSHVMDNFNALSDGSRTLTALQVDNININGNTIKSTDTNGDIILAPDGTGDVFIQTIAPQMRFRDTTNAASIYTLFDGNNIHGGIIIDADAGSAATNTVLTLKTDGTTFLEGDSSQNVSIPNGAIGFSSRGGLTISSGVITVTKSFHKIDTEGAGSTDDLDTINGLSEGDIIIISADDSTRTVVVKSGTGNILLDGGTDFSMDNANDMMMLIKLGSNWVEMTRSNNGA